MSEITVEQIVSVDGYATDAGGGIGFFADADFGDQSRVDSEQMEWLSEVDAILLGRRTYELFITYWPDADPQADAVAGPIARLPKYVLSNSLEHAPWGDGEIEILHGSAEDAARELRERHRSIVVWGSLELSDALFVAGQVDVLRLRTVPVLLGAGRPFAPPTTPRTLLRLEKSATVGEGVLAQQYRMQKAAWQRRLE